MSTRKKALPVATAIRRLHRAQQDAEQAILAAMEREAIRRRLTEVDLSYWEDRYFRDGKEVSNKKIFELQQLYCEEVHRGGLVGTWKTGKGWL